MNVNDVVPDFGAVDDQGREVHLSDYLTAGPVVLFFYPKAMTKGCTMEACHFRDLGSEFAAYGATRLGISGDAVDRQQQFKEEHDFDYPLLSDPDRSIAETFGVKRWGPLGIKRWTFVIDTNRRILDVIKSETNMQTHADEALAALAAHKG